MTDAPEKLESVITYLEMETPPVWPAPPHPADQLALMRAEEPTVAFYRFLYNTVGGPWLWWERRVLDDESLGEIVGDPAVEIYVLYRRGVPAGYAEIDRREAPDVELAYFGLMPEFIGRGLGKFFLRWAVDMAWEGGTRRVLVNTCTEDHPAALPNYQRAGFVPYKRETKVIDDPRTLPEFAGETVS